MKSLRDVIDQCAAMLAPGSATVMSPSQRADVDYTLQRARARQRAYLRDKKGRRRQAQASRRANRG